MWTDIDYMSARRVFTLDDERFPLDKMRELVSYLHKNDQHYIVMVDPAVSNSGKCYTYLLPHRFCSNGDDTRQRCLQTRPRPGRLPVP